MSKYSKIANLFDPDPAIPNDEIPTGRSRLTRGGEAVDRSAHAAYEDPVVEPDSHDMHRSLYDVNGRNGSLAGRSKSQKRAFKKMTKTVTTIEPEVVFGGRASGLGLGQSMGGFDELSHSIKRSTVGGRSKQTHIGVDEYPTIVDDTGKYYDPKQREYNVRSARTGLQLVHDDDFNIFEKEHDDDINRSKVARHYVDSTAKREIAVEDYGKPSIKVHLNN
jgi:hypothetical protein